jgi:hypothetical protein
VQPIKDSQQGLAVIASSSNDPNSSIFLSIKVDNQVSGTVADEYNALDHGTSKISFPNAGFLDRELSLGYHCCCRV